MPMQPENGIAMHTQPYLDMHLRMCDSLPGRHSTWHAQSRVESLERFARKGFPTLRDEDWKYTPVRPLVTKSFNPVTGLNGGVEPLKFSIPEISTSVVFVDGVPDLSHSCFGKPVKGLSVKSIASVLENDADRLSGYLGRSTGDRSHGFALLNDVLYCDGVVIEIEDNVHLKDPLELLFVSRTEAALALPRILVIAGKGSSCRIIERHVSDDSHSSLSSGITELFLDKRAQLDYHIVQTQSRSAYQIASSWAELAENSRLNCHTITVGGALIRNDLTVDLCGTGAQCSILGTYCLSGRQHVDNHITVVHSAPGCTSNELYKGVLNQRARGVFHGRIRVEADAQQTDAQQSNKTLLLSRDAEIDTKPQLEIYADDVKCSHGATIGQLDESAVFYLRSRGIDTDSARSLLIHSFVNEVLDKTDLDPLRDHLKTVVDERLEM